jgi:hypothetical protein
MPGLIAASAHFPERLFLAGVTLIGSMTVSTKEVVLLVIPALALSVSTSRAHSGKPMPFIFKAIMSPEGLAHHTFAFPNPRMARR